MACIYLDVFARAFFFMTLSRRGMYLRFIEYISWVTIFIGRHLGVYFSIPKARVRTIFRRIVLSYRPNVNRSYAPPEAPLAFRSGLIVP